MYDALTLALPASVAFDLLGADGSVFDRSQLSDMAPCWAATLSFEERLAIDANGISMNVPGSALAWACRDSSKPGRPGGEPLVLHAGPGCSHEHPSRDARKVAAELLASLGESAGGELPATSSAEARWWAHASSEPPESRGVLYDTASRPAGAGDWCLGGKVQGAYLGGVAAAGRVLGDLALLGAGVGEAGQALVDA